MQRRVLVFYRNLGDRLMTGKTNAEIGETLTHLGNYAEAEAELRIGFSYIQGIRAYQAVLRHRYLGDVLLAQGKFHEAVNAYQHSLTFFRMVGEKGWVYIALTGFSRSEFALEDRPNAWAHTFEALRIFHITRENMYGLANRN